MLIWNGREWAQFVGSRCVNPNEAGYPEYEACVSHGPLGGHDTVARQGPVFMQVLLDFLEDPD